MKVRKRQSKKKKKRKNQTRPSLRMACIGDGASNLCMFEIVPARSLAEAGCQKVDQ